MFVISGVTGHVGGAVASELVARNQKIKVILRNPTQGTVWSQRGCEVAVGSLEDEPFLTRTLQGARGFFALLPPNYQAADLYAWQRKTAQAIANGVDQSRVPLVVMLSSVGADLADGNGPIKGLHYLEEALRKTSTKLVALRPTYFQENIAGVLNAARSSGVFPSFAPSADVAMPMVATSDIGKMAADLLITPPAASEIVDLDGPAYSSRQVAEKLGTALGKPLRVLDVPPPEHVKTLEQAGIPHPLAEAFAEMYAGFAAGKIRPHGDRMVHAKTPIDNVISAIAH